MIEVKIAFPGLCEVQSSIFSEMDPVLLSRVVAFFNATSRLDRLRALASILRLLADDSEMNYLPIPEIEVSSYGGSF